MKTKVLLLSIIAMLMVSACGQKGDLYHTTDAPPPSMEKTSDK